MPNKSNVELTKNSESAQFLTALQDTSDTDQKHQSKYLKYIVFCYRKPISF